MSRRLRPLHLMIVLMGLAACAPAAPTPAETPLPTERPTQTPIAPSVEGWADPIAPLTVENIADLRLLGQLNAPEPPSTVFAHALAPDQTALAALNNDLLLMWDLIDGSLRWSVSRQGANRVYYAPDKETVYTVNSLGDINLFNAGNGAPLPSLRGHSAYSDAADHLPDEGVIALGGVDGTVRLWDVPARAARATLTDDPALTVAAVALATDSARVAVATDDGAVSVWDWRTGQRLARYPLGVTTPDLLWSPDGRYLAAGTGRALIAIDTQGNDGIRTLQTDGAEALLGFVPASPYLLTTEEGGAGIALWHIAEGRIAAVLTGIERQRGDRLAVGFSPDGRLLFVAGMGVRPTVWNITNLAQGAVARGNLAIPDDQLFSAVWTTDGFLILTFDALGPVKAWGVN